ncbi:MAG TPA: hypothetical protein VIM70_06510 [Clostridium sp.]|uniref:hypothetical protein n=1 Tax=Clostridium sp. TaxID=1506 RepID=UPI002F92CBA2
MREENITCSKCGAEYELHRHRIPMRDKDSETCYFCNTTLISWNGGVMYSTKLIKKGNIDK